MIATFLKKNQEVQIYFRNKDKNLFKKCKEYNRSEI